MEKSEKYYISLEIYKYPYCGNPDDNKDYLSDKICFYITRVRKKIVRKTKRVFIYGQLILSLGTIIAPIQAIGLPILPSTPSIMRYTTLNADLSKRAMIAQVIRDHPSNIVFTKTEIDQLYDLSIKYKNNFITEDELINRLTNLRGGGYSEIIGAFMLIFCVIIMMNPGISFQPNPGGLVPPHLEWLYGNPKPGAHFGFGKNGRPKSITIITQATENAGSDKKEPSAGSWNYKDIMSELDKKSSRKLINIEIGNEIYSIENTFGRHASYDLSMKLSEQIYDSIRECDTDICDIAKNLGFKATNIKNVKDHLFYNKHYLDRHPNPENKRFDASLSQVLAWKRLEAGIHTLDDITWIKHECAERHHELKYGSGYSEAHDRAQSRFDGAPWADKW